MGEVIDEGLLGPDDPIFRESLTVSGVARPHSTHPGKSDSAEEKSIKPAPAQPYYTDPDTGKTMTFDEYAD